MKAWLILLTIFLVASNFSAIYYLDPEIEEWFRFGATLVFFLIYLFKYFSKYSLLIVFILFAICDGLVVYYEIPVIKKTIYIVRILAYLNLILLVAPSLSRLKLNSFTILISLFIISIDVYLLHDMAKSLPYGNQDTFFLILFYSLGIISLAIIAVSISYLNRYANRAAFFLVIACMGFVLSDLFYYNAYYLEFREFFYLDRLANVVGLSALLAFSSKLVEVRSKSY